MQFYVQNRSFRNEFFCVSLSYYHILSNASFISAVSGYEVFHLIIRTNFFYVCFGSEIVPFPPPPPQDLDPGFKLSLFKLFNWLALLSTQACLSFSHLKTKQKRNHPICSEFFIYHSIFLFPIISKLLSLKNWDFAFPSPNPFPSCSNSFYLHQVTEIALAKEFLLASAK